MIKKAEKDPSILSKTAEGVLKAKKDQHLKQIRIECQKLIRPVAVMPVPGLSQTLDTSVGFVKMSSSGSISNVRERLSDLARFEFLAQNGNGMDFDETTI